MDTFSIEKINEAQLPELAGLKEKQMAAVKENPFIEIIDTKSYDEARKRRTALKTARTEIEKQDKLIVSKINDFKNRVKAVSQELVNITKPHEEKQQEEVSRWENIKEQERLEKLRKDEERKQAIQKKIQDMFTEETALLANANISNIDELKKKWESDCFQHDTSIYEEFAMSYLKECALLKERWNIKSNQLREDEARRLEDERLKAERAEIERKQAEFEKQQAEANAKLKAEQERIAKEQAEIAAKLKAEQEESERKQKEAQAIIDEQNRKLQEEKEKLAAEKAEKEKAEAEARAYQERKKTEKEAAKKAAALKPEKDKLFAFAESLQFSIEVPEINDEALAKMRDVLIERVQELKDKFTNHLSNI